MKLERAETQLRELLQLVLRGGPALEASRREMLAALGWEAQNRARGRDPRVDPDSPELSL